MPRWTAADIPDLRGKTALVTGANTGIGHHTALELARHGARVLLACRDKRRGAAAVDRIAAQLDGRRPERPVELVELDLANLESVAEAAAEVADRTDVLDILINNAGVMAPTGSRTADGFELQFGTNHLGHFALTGRLLAVLLSAEMPRVVTVSSVAHRHAQARFDDIIAEDGYHAAQRWSGYGRSKLANLLFAQELQRRAAAAGTPLMSTAAHPGYARTDLPAKTLLGRNAVMSHLISGAVRITGQSVAAGALPSLYAATSPEIHGGEYIGPNGPGEMRGAPGPARIAPRAKDPENAAVLWELSVSHTGVGYEALALTR